MTQMAQMRAPKKAGSMAGCEGKVGTMMMASAMGWMTAPMTAGWKVGMMKMASAMGWMTTG